MQPTPAVAGLAAEDEASVYEGEVRAREARLGPSHPDVAEAVSNLAILYNQVGACRGQGAAGPAARPTDFVWMAAVPGCPTTPLPASLRLLQRGDAGRALPLYERALAIWEAACGPDSPDVAHTLTDIAVIHLEQVGRVMRRSTLGSKNVVWCRGGVVQAGCTCCGWLAVAAVLPSKEA